jgi:putative transposase
VLAAFRYGESISDYKILVMNLESDHIHFLLKWKPSLSIEQVVRRMKQTSTVYLWQHHEQHFRRFYWRDRHIWTGGYFCATVGDVSEQNVNCCGAEDSAACPCTRPHVSTEVPRLWAC